MKTKRFLSLLLSLFLLIGTVPLCAFADSGEISGITVYFTVSDEGVLASDNDGLVMLSRPARVEDEDKDGVYSVDEALKAAHKAYNSEDGYSLSDEYGYVAVSKIWGRDTYNSLVTVNDVGIKTGVTVDTVKDGDKVVVSINKDNMYYGDWYTYFTDSEKTVKQGEEFTLTLVGHSGMAYTEDRLKDVPLSGISVGTWKDGAFEAADGKITDESGKVTLSFAEEGTYYVTASGTVRDTVTLDWSTFETGEVDCPIIAPGCIVTVEQTDSPSEVLSYLPAPGQFINLGSYSDPVRTLGGSALITLGSFGGNVVYKYENPIKNDPNNPYGIDFIVIGNCFKNPGGTTSSGAAEPAAVMVSKDGETWYELAGSAYYLASSKHDVTVTYENPDTSFSGAADVPWTDSLGGSGVIPKNPFHNQSYYPNPSVYSAYQAGIGSNDTYSAQSVSFTGTMIESGFYPFGYADSHAESTGAGNKAQNPYVKDHDTFYNGDGFDLAWAVDEKGDPVVLDEISYIKIYNPVLSYDKGLGEKSPEIKTVLRAMSNDTPVGVSRGLESLSINGGDIALEDGKYSYSASADGAGTLTVTPVSQNPDANIYVSDGRVISGESSNAISAVNKLRIIVQEGQAEPVIYMIDISGVSSAESNADLNSITLTPGDVKNYPGEDGSVAFTVASSVSSVRFTAETADEYASVGISGDGISETVVLASGETSPSVGISEGENKFTFKVTSQNGENEKIYNVTVTRKSSGGSSDSLVSVKFSLTGDAVHYDAESGSYTSKHTNPSWIPSQTVRVPAGSTVKYLTEMILGNAGLDYTTDGAYISEINGIAEFDNGPNSGWMYRHNGHIADEGYASRTLSQGDTIKWFYTDDYTKESDYEGGYGSSSSGSSSSGGSASVTYCTVTFDTDGGSEVASKTVEKGSAAAKPADPTKEGFALAGWYTDKDCTAEYDFSSKVTSDITLYAKWESTENSSDEEHEGQSRLFSDVESGAWYEAAVSFAVENGLFNGVSEDLFAPYDSMTRAMTVTVLYRLENPSESGGENIFEDLEEDWYLDAVTWASESGIVKGKDESHFAPYDEVTREEIAVIFYRYAFYKGYVTDKSASLDEYSDSGKISDWAKEEMQWAVASGLINGTASGVLSPGETASRAQVAQIFMRFCEKKAA